jgi:hypothetical protein
MGRVEVCAIDWVDRPLPLDGAHLEYRRLEGDWREWLAPQVAEAGPDDLILHPTAVPGLSIVMMDQWTAAVFRSPNYTANRVRYGPIKEEVIHGTALALNHTDRFGGRLLNLTPIQRLAIEAAATAEWDVLRWLVERMKDPG